MPQPQPQQGSRRRPGRDVRLRALNELVSAATEHANYVSFDAAVDLVDYHFQAQEQQLKELTNAVEWLGQTVSFMFLYTMLMRVMTGR